MDIVFNCSNCNQELSVDSSAAGSEFDCPTCGSRVVVPEAEGPNDEHAPSAPHTSGIVNAIKASAAAREEHHFKVPVHDRAPETLIEKPRVPLEAAAKEAVKIRVKTIRHSDCVEVGHDKFDEIVTNFLNKVGETHVVSIQPITYQYIEIGSQKVVTDYGLVIIYKTE
jgi:DNA-directed RNA polymerase subunit RPC12/RpoP